jgi:hypothetical protein
VSKGGRESFFSFRVVVRVLGAPRDKWVPPDTKWGVTT